MNGLHGMDWLKEKEGGNYITISQFIKTLNNYGIGLF